MTANAFTSVSVDPVLMLVCFNKSVYPHHRVVEERRFGISILTKNAQHMPAVAYTRVRAAVAQRRLREDAGSETLALNGALAYLDCTIYVKHET
jgi:flavin reductase (DIM6/NTAB) family NADH-FMN oxidoreductase RutF